MDDYRNQLEPQGATVTQHRRRIAVRTYPSELEIVTT